MGGTWRTLHQRGRLGMVAEDASSFEGKVPLMTYHLQGSRSLNAPASTSETVSGVFPGLSHQGSLLDPMGGTGIGGGGGGGGGGGVGVGYVSKAPSFADRGSGGTTSSNATRGATETSSQQHLLSEGRLSGGLLVLGSGTLSSDTGELSSSGVFVDPTPSRPSTPVPEAQLSGSPSQHLQDRHSLDSSPLKKPGALQRAKARIKRIVSEIRDQLSSTGGGGTAPEQALQSTPPSADKVPCAQEIVPGMPLHQKSEPSSTPASHVHKSGIVERRTAVTPSEYDLPSRCQQNQPPLCLIPSPKRFYQSQPLCLFPSTCLPSKSEEGPAGGDLLLGLGSFVASGGQMARVMRDHVHKGDPIFSIPFSPSGVFEGAASSRISAPTIGSTAAMQAGGSSSFRGPPTLRSESFLSIFLILHFGLL